MIEMEKELLSGAFPNAITKHDNVYKHDKIDKWKIIIIIARRLVLQMTIMPMSEIMEKFEEDHFGNYVGVYF